MNESASIDHPASPKRVARAASRPAEWILEHRRPFIVLFHLGLAAVSGYVAIWLRFDGAIPAENWAPWLRDLPWLLVLRALTFATFGLYRGLWRYTDIWDLRNIVSGVVVSSLANYLLVHWAFGLAGYPRAVFMIDSGLLILLMSGVRMLRRMNTELWHAPGGRRVLVYGAGDAGEMIIREMRSNSSQPYRPIGLIDDDRAKVGLRIHGVPVLGTSLEVAAIIEAFKPHEVLIAIPRAEPAAIRSIVRSLEPFKIPIKTLPNLRDLIDGKVDLAKIRSLSVEDLLVRAPVGLDTQPVKSLIAGRRVLVTGAGGSIGSELCRQIANLKPASLVMLDRYENTLHAIRVELDDLRRACRIIPVIGDVTDAARVNAVLGEHEPEIIFHAAAHKHVPLMEENPCEAVKNNVRGTRLLAQAADAHGVDRFILISTDKAVNPTSLMGASKRVAELVVQAQAVGSGTSFSIVRFGNVLGSNGSVVPRFLDQIRKGGPVTVTHPDIRRFFMLIPEAVQLVLHAASHSRGSATYVLEMGEQVKVLDMARHLIRLSGLIPEDDIKIDFTGLRPGEKLYEELFGDDEEAGPSAVKNILCVRSKRQPDPQLFARVDALERAALTGSTEAAIEAMKELIGTFGRVDDSTSDTEERLPIQVAAAADIGNDGGQPCPSCHDGRLCRSRARTLRERLWKVSTTERLFRCNDCGWRGWLEPLQLGHQAPIDRLPAVDLTILDAVAKSGAAALRPSFSPRNLH
jgi:FlaA1/EpsC-like NDP-sugar epimerase